MKKLIFSALVVISLNAMSQTDSIPFVDGQYQYSEVVKLDSSFTKDKLYRNAKLYFTDNFKSAKDVIQYDEKQEGKVIGKGYFESNVKTMIMLTADYIKTSVYYSTEITCKDGRYRYKIYDINLKSEDNTTFNLSDIFKSRFNKKYRTGLYNDIVIHFKAVMNTLKEYMSKDQAAKKDDF